MLQQHSALRTHAHGDALLSLSGCPKSCQLSIASGCLLTGPRHLPWIKDSTKRLATPTHLRAIGGRQGRGEVTIEQRDPQHDDTEMCMTHPSSSGHPAWCLLSLSSLHSWSLCSDCIKAQQHRVLTWQVAHPLYLNGLSHLGSRLHWLLKLSPHV